MISARGLMKRYGGISALDGVDLDVGRGEKLVVLGQSGSGKSTLIRCLNGLVKPDRGTIIVDGTRLDLQSEASLRRLRQRVAMVPPWSSSATRWDSPARWPTGSCSWRRAG